jgi:hypothetical protein
VRVHLTTSSSGRASSRPFTLQVDCAPLMPGVRLVPDGLRSVSVGEKLVPMFMPSLAALLLNSERTKGAPLTHQEVISVRDNGVCVMVPQSVARKMEESRGYRDVDPENCWEDWNALRSELERDEGEA